MPNVWKKNKDAARGYILYSLLSAKLRSTAPVFNVNNLICLKNSASVPAKKVILWVGLRGILRVFFDLRIASRLQGAAQSVA
ncbi:hypothetical protein DFP92_1198 [Yoonia sediminilitoris]|uniref:Uncharacterized protein n=1 Tax=Yoonia sediminilitoris TaxID=1286148 RepID=A0A2T6K6T0_9RHOB|nr:hypothetical protein C8N45_1198 [Yoonia sediminilitoris]RCW89847.1 hypothetical protein DFP92_1198 [Yoonia sediminilitoris]